MTHPLTSLALALFAGVVQAGTIHCAPGPIGPGTVPVVKSTPKGDFAAWYCPDRELPELSVCAKATCSLVGTKRSIAAVASSPTLETINAELAKYSGNPYKDPELIAVWKPYAAEILKSAK